MLRLVQTKLCDNGLRAAFEVPEEIAMKPAFSTEYGAVYKADCLKLFAALRDECVDTVFADPPFNLGKDYGNGADKDEWQASVDYLKWCYGWMDEAVRVLKPGGAFFLYNLPRWAFHLAVHLEAQHMTFRHWIAVSMKGTFPRGKKALSGALRSSILHERRSEDVQPR